MGKKYPTHTGAYGIWKTQATSYLFDGIFDWKRG